MVSDLYNQDFDLRTLLKLGDLDIRGVAANDDSLSADKYFKMLSQFLNDAPMVGESLTQITRNVGDETDFQKLEAAGKLLESIGRHKLALNINDILDAKKNGDKQLAGFRALKISAEFNKLYERTMTARIIKEADKGSSASMAGTNNKNYGGLSLKKVLALLDHEEDNRKLRILAVDDNVFMLKTISHLLGDDYEVFSLTNPALVEGFLRYTTPELFLLDYTMPEISGFELIPIIRSFEEHKDTPIIFLTAVGTSDHVTAAVSLGACDFVVKPVKPDILREKIARYIVRKRDWRLP